MAGDRSPLKVLVARLTPEKTVSLSFSHKFIFELIVSRFAGKVTTDYFFFPERKKFSEIRAAGYHGAVSKQLGLPLSAFDVIAVSNSFQLELINLYHLISMAGAPVRLKDRLAGEKFPLVVAGGVNTPSLACVTGGAASPGTPFDDGTCSLLDAVFLGEAERNFPAFIEAALADPGWKRSKYAFLEKVSSEVPGVFFPPKYIHEFEYIPGSGEMALKKITPAPPAREFTPVRAAVVESLDGAFEFGGVIFDESEAGATVPVEITRGCPSMCSFCKEGYTQKPYREKSAAAVVSLCRRLRAASGLSRFNLYSYNFNDHSHIHDIVEGIASASLTAEVKSQRVDTALLMPRLLSCLQASGSASPTFAVEGISDRLRRYLSKNLGSAAADKFIEVIFTAKPRQVKLFFIITGLEDENDIAEFNEFRDRLLKSRKASSPGTAVVFSFMPLVPCQKTPLIYAPAPDPAKVFATVDRLSKALSGRDGVTARSSIGPELYGVSVVMEYGGREITGAVIDLAAGAGFAYYEQIGDRIFDRFMAGVKKCGFAFSRLYSEKGPDAVFNSDDRDYGIGKRFLYGAWLRARRFEDTPRCLRNGARKCLGCGACPGADSVYDWVDVAKRDASFMMPASKSSPAGASAVPFGRAAVAVTLPESKALPHPLIARFFGDAPFKITGDSISKLPDGREKFSGKNYYLIEAPADALSAAASARPENVTRARSLDFISVCNYIFIRVKSSRRFLKNAASEKNALAIFGELNPKFKAVSIKAGRNLFGPDAPGAPYDFTIITNGDGLKKRPALPLAISDNAAGALYCLIRADKETLAAIDEAEIIEYVTIRDYNVKDPATVCAACGRVWSGPCGAAAGPLSSADSGRCFICSFAGAN